MNEIFSQEGIFLEKCKLYEVVEITGKIFYCLSSDTLSLLKMLQHPENVIRIEQKVPNINIGRDVISANGREFANYLKESSTFNNS